MMSYSDVLKNLKDDSGPGIPEPISISNKPPMQQQRHPQQQQYHSGEYQMNRPAQHTSMDGFVGLPYNPSYQQPTAAVCKTPTTVTTEDTSSTTFQNEMLTLLAVYLIIHTPQFQQMVRGKIPGLVSENGSSNVMGTLINGVLLIVVWNVSKKIVVKYMKDL